MTLTKYADLSGSGVLTLDAIDEYGYLHTVVTDLGFSHTIELASPLRYVDVGWICPAEIWVSIPGGADGTYFVDRRWIEFEFQTFDYHTLAVNIFGFDSVGYSLRAGVVVDLYVFTP